MPLVGLKMQANVEKLHRSLTRRYILGLGLVAVLSTLAFTGVRSVISAHEFSGRVINLSGRQRMLSQRLEMLAERMQVSASRERAATVAEMRAALTEFTAAHRTLTKGSAELSLDIVQSPAVQQLFYSGPRSLNSLVLVYIGTLNRLALSDNTAEQAVVLQQLRRLSAEGLLQRLDDVVGEYQRESDGSVRRLQDIEALIWALTLALLALEVHFIFRPLTRTVLNLFSSLTDAREVAMRATDAKSSFLATITHEIRTPMIGVQGIANLMLESELNSYQRENIGTVKRMSDALILLVNDILDFSKMEAGKLSIEAVDLDLRTLLRDSEQMFRATSDQKGVELSYHLDADVLPLRQGDALRLSQILTNFIGNALKFTARGGSVAVTVTRASDLGQTGLRIAVKDSGIGLTPEQQAGLFSRFSQAEGSTARRYGGTGLGLAIAKQIAELMQGHIGCDSVVGHGSTFWVTLVLPFSKPSLVQAPSTAISSKPAMGLWAGQRALVAEDNPVNQMIAVAVLKKLGLSLHVVADGQAAVEAAAAEDFAVVFMDCEMPVLDGFGATRAIRANAAAGGKKAVPIVAMTAHLADSVQALCLEAGMDRFLTKPIELAAVHACVLELLGPTTAATAPTESTAPTSPKDQGELAA